MKKEDIDKIAESILKKISKGRSLREVYLEGLLGGAGMMTPILILYFIAKALTK